MKKLSSEKRARIKAAAVVFFCAFWLIYGVIFFGAYSVTKEEKDITASEPTGEFSVVDSGEKYIMPLPLVRISDMPLPNENVSAVLKEAVESEPTLTERSLIVFDVETGKNIDIPFEQYVLGVLLSEMPTSFCDQALMAQAVACRTYTLYRINTQSAHASGAFLCTSASHCQAFCLPEQVSRERYEKAKKAVDETAGEIMLYEDEPILAVFHASSHKRTRSSQEVWGGKRPYLLSVETFECENPRMNIKKEYFVERSDFLEAFGFSSDIAFTPDIKRSDSGRVVSVAVGEKSMSGEDFVKAFGLRSASYDITDSQGGITIVCAGYGHGVGMSQYGAEDMAQRGYGYREILSHYYTGITLGNM